MIELAVKGATRSAGRPQATFGKQNRTFFSAQC
jgi:hypothetical protein